MCPPTLKMKKLLIIGSTGSIGRQALQVVDNFPAKLKVVGLTAKNNIELLEKQIRKYKPLYVAVDNIDKAWMLKERVADLKVTVQGGTESLVEIAQKPDYQILLVATVGFSGFLPTIAAIQQGKTIALATKEILVAGGSIVCQLAKENRATILPVDSEHSAIFQCLEGYKTEAVDRLILTASGGPFLGYNRTEMKKVTPAGALNHPNWKMGNKITIDSATLMNKGLEVIEAHWLFNVDYDNIDVIIHPQSIIHSFVEFIDGSQLAQLGFPDMNLPIQYALSYPERWSGMAKKLHLATIGRLTFEEPDNKNFPCLALAYAAGKIAGTMPAVLNAANEVAVEHFLHGKISFLDIPVVVEEAMLFHSPLKNFSIDELLMADQWARRKATQVIEKRRRFF